MQIRNINGQEYLIVKEHHFGDAKGVYAVTEAVNMRYVKEISESGEVSVYDPVNSITFISFKPNRLDIA